MPGKVQAIELQRKSPRQARGVQTRETLLDAAVQVLHREGDQRFTTNRIAEAAGFSIGTLYQYFPNKTAIIKALVQRECIAIEAKARKAMMDADPTDPAAVIRIFVRSAIRAFGGSTRVRKFIILHLVRLKVGAVGSAAVEVIFPTFLQALTERCGDQIRPLSEAASFILTRAMLGAIRGAVLEERTILLAPDFEDELVRMALGFVRP